MLFPGPQTVNCQLIQEERREMNPRKRTVAEPEVDDIMDPFREPRTIPTGWDVSSFYAPERENLPYYVMEHTASKSASCQNTPHDYTKNTLR
jgi:hypothetical protein